MLVQSPRILLDNPSMAISDELKLSTKHQTHCTSRRQSSTVRHLLNLRHRRTSFHKGPLLDRQLDLHLSDLVIRRRNVAKRFERQGFFRQLRFEIGEGEFGELVEFQEVGESIDGFGRSGERIGGIDVKLGKCGVAEIDGVGLESER